MPHCAPVDNYRFAHEPEINLPAFPMDLYMCSACGHAQLLDVVSPEVLYGNYIYNSSSSPDLNAHFSSYASLIIERYKIVAGSFIIDIGSNDGLLLSKFRDYGVRVQGVDASASVVSRAVSAGIPTIISFLNSAVVDQILQSSGPADIVCANNVFSHADDLRGFAICVRRLLKTTGVFVFEVSYLRDLVENKVIDYVYHEHLAHHSVKPIKIFLDSIGLRLVDVERIAVKGGSIRCHAVLRDASFIESASVEKMIAEEESIGLYKPELYLELKRYIDGVGQKVRDALRAVVDRGGLVAAYGASATATVLSEIFGINKEISMIIDDNPLRQGRFSPGARIPVKSRHDFLKAHPELTVVTAWRFADMIIAKNRDYLDSGGVFVVPLPTYRVVSKESEDP